MSEGASPKSLGTSPPEKLPVRASGESLGGDCFASVYTPHRKDSLHGLLAPGGARSLRGSIAHVTGSSTPEIAPVGATSEILGVGF